MSYNMPNAAMLNAYGYACLCGCEYMLHQKGIVVAVVMANWVALLFTLLRMGEIGQSVKMECVIAGGAISQMSRDPDRKT